MQTERRLTCTGKVDEGARGMRRGRHRPDHVDLGKPWERTLYFILLVMGSVRVVGNTVCERIHKEKKVQRVKFYFTFPREGKG